MRVQDQPDQHGETLSLLKTQKISRVWWRMPVIPATREAEAGESLEPRRGGCSELRLHHCTPAWATRVKLSQKQKSVNFAASHTVKQRFVSCGFRGLTSSSGAVAGLTVSRLPCSETFPWRCAQQGTGRPMFGHGPDDEGAPCPATRAALCPRV